jgi:aspartyl protease family protein
MIGKTWAYVALFILGTVGLVLLLNASFPNALAEQGSQIRLVHSLGLLVLVGSSVVVGLRNAPGLALKQAFTWIGIFLTMIVLFSYRFEFEGLAQRVGMNLSPSSAVTIAPGEVSIGASDNGHYIADALVEGTHVRFLIDTGASIVTLTEFDAQRVGIKTDALTYNMPMNTANGRNFAAPVILEDIKIGDVRVFSVHAVVIRDGLTQSLLGMSFLNELSGYEVDQNRLLLRQ